MFQIILGHFNDNENCNKNVNKKYKTEKCYQCKQKFVLKYITKQGTGSEN